ncbi:hypothetical protein [Halovenus carboxidivorans]|uniref:hypothetical protein n=1 Tax=Halovenus carboxidivorans TaxID=2692199 RepID=UPI0034A4157B
MDGHNGHVSNDCRPFLVGYPLTHGVHRGDSRTTRLSRAIRLETLSTLKSIQDHLSDLHMLGFLRRHERNEGLSGGQYYEYELDLDPEIVLETRTEIAKHTR